uniref:protein PAT1 homolog 1 n=1 Tax=Ciona intestinalis TaxID=7719 RepID=UPI0000522B06|nr:protein PAT1 homolog 1 [Ciona intestinalis]|eukprot:XP_002127239.1 protein PAT1 homolog 1 [Ciona intestinalis]
MSDVYLQHISSTPGAGMDNYQNNEASFGQDNIDLLNEDTFGAGAVEEDWELDHNQLVGLHEGVLGRKQEINSNIESENNNQVDDLQPFTFESLHSPLQLDDEELERSNQQLAAAVEELVLNSDQDQDMIDPAIVSLRRQPQSVHLAASPKLPPFYSREDEGPRFNNSNVSNIFNRPDNLYTSDNLRNIWNESSLGQSILSASLTLPVDNKPINDNGNLQFEDEAILSISRDTSDFDRPSLLSSPLVVSAEDLEREMQGTSSPRGPSPTYGISIPSNNNHDPVDRSLPPRSVSPLFGSPSPSNMPIGTPPKHVIMNMMHHLEQQQQTHPPPPHPNLINTSGSSGSLPHPPLKFPPGLPPPRLPPFIRGPPPIINSGMPIGVPQPRNVVWPNQQPMNPLIAQDIMNRLGMRPPTPQPNHPSPIGSPRAFMVPPPRLMSNPRQMHLPPGGVRPVPRRQMPGFNNERFMHPMPAPQFGPGHLHPEHSKYVRMRQQRYGGHDSMGRSRNYKRHQYEERIGIPGDPYANIMNQKEKDWVIRIQMMALQSDRPEIDDYYYQNYIERRLREGRLNSDQSKPARLITPTKPNLENRKYVPVQFSNSLGKLTTSSVYNPRQIIDIVQTANQDEETAGDAADTRQALSKRLVVYKTIEKAYEIIVLMEELQAQIQLCPPNASARRSLGDHLQSKTRQMLDVLDLHDGMAFDLHDDPIFQVMKIRKGKKLIGRTLHFLPQTHAVTVIQSIFSHFAILIKRDARDGVLHELYVPISSVLSSLDRAKFIQLCSLLSTFAITAAVKDQVGVSIICKLLHEGSAQFNSCEDSEKQEWFKFVSNVSDIIVAVANPKEGSRHARPTTPSPLLENFPYHVFEVLSSQPTEKNSSEKIKSSVEQLISKKSFEIK